MPRNGSGVMSIPNTLVTQTTVEVGPHNANYADIAAEITNSVAVDGQSQLSGPLKSASGTVASPGITFGSDTDSGLYRIGGDNIGFSIGGTKLLDMASGAFGVTGTLAVSGALSAASLAITADLPISEGGTGQSTATAAFDALAPTTTRGDIITRGASNNGRLAIGAADTVLKSDGTDAAYGKIVAANVTDGVLTHAKLASGVTASQANMEAASATDVFVPPGRQHLHPGHPKAGGNLNGTGTPAFRSGDYGMGAVTDNGTGDYTVALDTAFNDTNYWTTVFARHPSTSPVFLSAHAAMTKTASSFQFLTDQPSSGAVDSTEMGMSFGATMPKRIVYTRPDGGVSVCAPSLTALRYMTGGGGRWDGYPSGFLDRQIAKQSGECGERNAHRFVMAMQFGGCTDAEAHELMRDRFCAHLGSGIELWDVADVPADRWFRDAWLRSHNGGPIDVSLDKAKAIQFRKIKHAVDRENQRRLDDIELFDRPIEPGWSAIRDAIRSADDVTCLRRVWPRELGS